MTETRAEYRTQKAGQAWCCPNCAMELGRTQARGDGIVLEVKHGRAVIVIVGEAWIGCPFCAGGRQWIYRRETDPCLPPFLLERMARGG